MRQHQAILLIRYVGLLGLLAWSLFGAVAATYAQQPTWREQRTEHFAILFPAGAEPEAAAYARFVDPVYDELAAIFAYRTPTPVPLRIYPTMELYYQANPLAAQVPGVTAHAHTGRREISIALPQTAGQTEPEIVNNVRHELTHIIAADLSGGKLTTAFQEGIAQYVEHPTPALDHKMQLLGQALHSDRLFSWRDLNRANAPYTQPHIAYPQSYSIVAFLVERDGFATFKRFIELSKTSSGYRGALQAAYGVGADQLEAEWRAQLEQFIDGGYRQQATGELNLSQIEALIARGEYAPAEREILALLASLPEQPPSKLVAQAEALLQKARDGQQLAKLAQQARTALEQGDYAAAQQAAEQGRALVERLGQPAQQGVIEEYQVLAQDGLAAQQQLATASEALRSLDIGAARRSLADAYRTFTRLGDQQQAAVAYTALLSIQRSETVLALTLIGLGLGMLGWNVHRRVRAQRPKLPFG